MGLRSFITESSSRSNLLLTSHYRGGKLVPTAPCVYGLQVKAISYSKEPTHLDLITGFYILSKPLNHPELWAKFLSKKEDHYMGLPV